MNTVIRTDPKFSTALDAVKQMVSEMPDGRLKQNYGYKNLHTEDWVAISLFENGFSSISYRSIWENNCRILNRFYKTPDARFENEKRKVSQTTLDMIQQQLDIAKILDFDCAFMSRETKTQAFLHYKKFLPQSWHVTDDKYIAWRSDGSSVYQHIMWTPLNSNEFIMEKEICMS
jgi:hypothetical protein